MHDNFEKKASDWDTPGRIALADRFSDELNKIFPEYSGLSILEFGCGTGLVGLKYADKSKALHMVDTSRAMLDVLRTKDAAEGNNVHIHEGALSSLVEESTMLESIDWIISNMALHHVENIPELICSMHRILKPGGRVTIGDLVTEPGTFHAPDVVPHNGFDPDELSRHFEEAGFMVNTTYTYLTMPRVDNDGETRTYSTFILDATRSS